MKKSIGLNVSARIMGVHGVTIIGNIDNGSFMALNAEGEEIVERVKLGFLEIEMDEVSDEIKNVIETGIECEIFDDLNSESKTAVYGIRAAYFACNKQMQLQMYWLLFRKYFEKLCRRFNDNRY